MSNYIDPTYLRAIREGLLNGKLEKENEVELPEGLAELFDKELFPLNNTISEKQLLLHFFLSFALLQKNVNPQFIAEILDWEERKVSIFIYKYSKWFSASGNNQFRLYHDRFRVYILQKITSKTFSQFNNKLIQICNQSITSNSNEENKLYALEHLSSHLYVKAMLDGDGSKLKQFAYDTAIWELQIKASKGFEWSKKMLGEMMQWASKFDEEGVIECALNKVDLYHQEQNDAPRIVQLVADGDIDTALERIEKFGGDDKEDLQRKFTLYMLCLMELTLLNSKEKLHAKSGIERILKHFDEKMPEDHSILNWNDFFPSYLMFQMACFWLELGLDYLIIYKRTKYWEKEWVGKKGPYSDLQFNFLKKFTNNEYRENTLLKDLFNELTKQGKIEEALTCISNDFDKNAALKDLLIEFAKKGDFKKVDVYFLSLTDDFTKWIVLIFISTELAKHGKIDEALSYTDRINRDFYKFRAFKSIAIELTKNKNIEEAFKFINKIGDEEEKNSAISYISIELAKQGNFEIALKYAFGIFEVGVKSFSLQYIAIELAKHGKISHALECINDIGDDDSKNSTISGISIELSKKGKFDLAIEYNLIIKDELYKSISLEGITLELAKKQNINKAFEYVKIISNEDYKNKAIKNISIELAKQQKFDIAFKYALSITENYEEYRSCAIDLIISELSKFSEKKKVQEYVRNINDNFYRDKAMISIAVELTKQHLVADALEYSVGINDPRTYNKILIQLFEIGKIENIYTFLCKKRKNKRPLKDVSIEFAKKGKHEAALILVNEDYRLQNDMYEKSLNLMNVAIEITNNKINLVTDSIIKESVKCANLINDYFEKSMVFIELSTKLFNLGKLKQSLSFIKKAKKFANKISDDIEKADAMLNIALKFLEQGSQKQSSLILKEILESIKSLELNRHSKKIKLKEISVMFSKQGNVDDAILCANLINDDWILCQTYSNISTELHNIGMFKLAESLIKEAIKFTNTLSNEFGFKDTAIKNICFDLIKQGRAKQAFKFAKTISNKFCMDEAFVVISSELSRQGNLLLAEKIGFKIIEISTRYNCWLEIAENTYEKLGWEKSIEKTNHLQNIEMKKYYLKGWVEKINYNESDKDLFLKTRHNFKNYYDSLDLLLQKFAVNQLFFSNLPKEKIDRYNRSLNIQWAIDIKNQLPN